MRRAMVYRHFLAAILAAAAIVHNAGASIAAVPSSSGNPASKSVLAALLESPATEMMELVEQAGMLQSLEFAADRHNLTIFAPRDEFFELHLDPGLRNFLLQPDNARFLQDLVMFHVVPEKITASEWRAARFQTLSTAREELALGWNERRRLSVDQSSLVDWPDMIVRGDGVVHRIDGLLVPGSVTAAYAAAISDGSIAAEAGAARSLQESGPPRLFHVDLPVDDLAGAVSSPSPAPAPSPSPSFSADGRDRVRDFVAALLAYGGYGEFADLLVNLTAMSIEIASLVDEGHALTVLAASDRAINRLAGEHLMGIESILSYHVLAEYHTEESLYALAKRHGTAALETLHERPGNQVVATEADGVVEFSAGGGGGGGGSSKRSRRSRSTALLMDPNIYADGRISVQGISAVLIPPRGAADDHDVVDDDDQDQASNKNAASFKDKPVLQAGV